MAQYLAWLLAVNEDPLTDLLQRDWVGVGGWSLFIGLCVGITIGNFTELWVPGRRYRRLEVAAQKISDANDALTKQNGELIQANEIAKHFFEAIQPKKGVVKRELVEKESDSPQS